MAYESAERMGGDGTALGAGLGGARLAEKLEVVEDSLREVRGRIPGQRAGHRRHLGQRHHNASAGQPGQDA